MKSTPLPFTAPMVLAVLFGTKTQTRRIAKPRRKPSLLDGSWTDEYVLGPGNRDWLMSECPYGGVGDLLWVREAWRTSSVFNGTPPRNIPSVAPIWYEAQDDLPFHPSAYGKLRPGMFMPRWASRITLEVTAVRVERLQDISESDAKAEGVPFPYGGWVGGYQKLWEQINGPDSWDANPWVWVIEFKKVEVV